MLIRSRRFSEKNVGIIRKREKVFNYATPYSSRLQAVM